MKQWITLAAATAIFISCSKQNLQEENIAQQSSEAVQASALRSMQDGAYMSGWENYGNWSKTDEGRNSLFSIERKTAEVNDDVTNGGLVLTYAKVDTQEPEYALFKEPKMMPFYFLPESERPNPNDYHFSGISSQGKLGINYRVPYTKQDMPQMGGGTSLQAMQFQHVVMSRAFLERKGLTSQTVQNNYTYNQVMDLIQR